MGHNELFKRFKIEFVIIWSEGRKKEMNIFGNHLILYVINQSNDKQKTFQPFRPNKVSRKQIQKACGATDTTRNYLFYFNALVIPVYYFSIFIRAFAFDSIHKFRTKLNLNLNAIDNIFFTVCIYDFSVQNLSQIKTLI